MILVKTLYYKALGIYGGIKKFFHVHDNILQISTIDDTKSESETKSKNQGLIYEKTSLLQIG